MLRRRLLLTLCVFSAVPAAASAHYLWILAATKGDEDGQTVNLYFEGGPAAGDGQYLDPFVEHGKTWVRTPDMKQAKLINMEVRKTTGKRWLASQLKTSGPLRLESYGKWGVYKYGDTDVLLHYYAKSLKANPEKEFQGLAKAENLELDIIPEASDEEIRILVLWQGKPLTNVPVSVRGPKGFKASLQTGEDGTATSKTNGSGRYTFRTTRREPDKTGIDGGKEYQEIRRHSTLVLELP